MQGWSPDFVSLLTERAIVEGLVDEIVPVAGGDALRLARELATREGIFVGTSSGATLAAALDVAQRAPRGSHIVCMLPDTGERYLSTPLFDGIEADMNEEELALSRSTPGYRFDAPAPPAAPPSAQAAVGDAAGNAEAEALVSNAIHGDAVVMFALEWCEFCWAVRKLLARLGIAYRSVDIDSVALQEKGLDTKVRSVLKDRSGAPTVPQIWIGGIHVGGAMDLFDTLRSGRLQPLLAAAGVACAACIDIDPDQFLPKWLHPRKAA
jgi:cysteine synthase